MKLPRALSYSSFSLLEKNAEEFYIQYLADKTPPRAPQTPAMAVGSGFDAYVKAALHSALFGPGTDPRYEFGAIFESQVEPQNWDFALRAGKYCFKAYRFCGAYRDLLSELEQSITPPRFEFRLEKELGGVPFVGKPDCQFVLDLGEGIIDCVYDWKIHGFCSKHAASPTKGYAVCLDCFGGEKRSRSHGKEHGLYLAKQWRGVTVNAGYMETCSDTYADQLCLYGWLLGEVPGDEGVVLGIEELVAKPMGEGTPPQLRYARHRALCKREYQLRLMERIKAAWAKITSGHFFPEMSKEDSDARCRMLDEVGVGMISDGSEVADWMNAAVRPQYRG